VNSRFPGKIFGCKEAYLQNNVPVLDIYSYYKPYAVCRSSAGEITPFMGTAAVGWIKAQGVAGAAPF